MNHLTRPLGFLLAAVPLLASCQSQPGPSGATAPRTATVQLTPVYQAGRLTQAVVAPWSFNDVATLDVVPMRWSEGDQAYFPFSKTDGATVSVESADKVIVSIAARRNANGNLAFTNLPPLTKYRFQARAVTAGNQTLSDPARSILDLDVGLETAPVLARIPVQLIDKTFGATGKIGLRQRDTTGLGVDHILVGLYRPGGLEAIADATASFRNYAGKLNLTNLPPNTSFWAKAEALDASGSIVFTATQSLEVTDDDQVPTVTLDIGAAPV